MIALSRIRLIRDAVLEAVPATVTDWLIVILCLWRCDRYLTVKLVGAGSTVPVPAPVEPVPAPVEEVPPPTAAANASKLTP